MSEFKGTKGKWKIGVVPSYNDTLKSAMLEIQSGSVWVCKVQNNGIVESEEGKYNALLISKAPELLEMLEELHGMLTDAPEMLGEYVELYRNKLGRLIKSATET